MRSKLRYIQILNNICNYYCISQNEFVNLLKNKENKYLLLLILKNNNCLECESIKEMLNIKTSKCIRNNLRLAEEKLLINREFREEYFELEDNIKKYSKIN